MPSPTSFLRPLNYALGLSLLTFSVGCSPFSGEPYPGPDKQAVGTWGGAVTGAGTGAVIGTQVSAGTGPGAIVGMGFGALFGMFSGLGVDLIEEDELRRVEELEYLRQVAWVQEVLAEHYARRMELHPNREIFPADWFFESDATKLKPEAEVLVRELAYLMRRRLPWSRIVVAAYNTSADPNSTYARHLTKRRAEEIAIGFVRAGIEPRRVLTRPQVLDEPILLDPDDWPGRYRQAIEFIAVDN
ncbi:MAG: hypothetical protein KDD69_01275 [Bdellovibrionales bacterium]|nr:hypothetical protein [Bdellovibrionales bacterium]